MECRQDATFSLCLELTTDEIDQLNSRHHATVHQLSKTTAMQQCWRLYGSTISNGPQPQAAVTVFT
jgi:hypothetical protein